jgi:hypothetical protein
MFLESLSLLNNLKEQYLSKLIYLLRSIVLYVLQINRFCMRNSKSTEKH